MPTSNNSAGVAPWVFRTVVAVVLIATMLGLVGYIGASGDEPLLATGWIVIVSGLIGAPVVLGLAAFWLGGRRGERKIAALIAVTSLVMLLLGMLGASLVPGMFDAAKQLFHGTARGTPAEVGARPAAAWVEIRPASVDVSRLVSRAAAWTDRHGRPRTHTYAVAPIVASSAERAAPGSPVTLFACDDEARLRTAPAGVVAGRQRNPDPTELEAIAEVAARGTAVGAAPRCITATLADGDTLSTFGLVLGLGYLLAFAFGGASTLGRLGRARQA